MYGIICITKKGFLSNKWDLIDWGCALFMVTYVYIMLDISHLSTLFIYLIISHFKKYFKQTPEIIHCCPVKHCLVPQ